jgi:hypothetical protein
MTADEIAAALREAVRAVQVPAIMQDYDAHPMRLALAILAICGAILALAVLGAVL